MSKTFDLSTLNLSAGTHEITVKSRASGYLDSSSSNAVSYVVAEETPKLSGTWKFNETIDAYWIFEYGSDEFSFYCDGLMYNGIYCSDTPGWDTEYSSDENSARVYSSYDDVWKDETYRTITIDGEQSVSQEFYEWFTANAVKQ